jgi:hypothetical protein
MLVATFIATNVATGRIKLDTTAQGKILFLAAIKCLLKKFGKSYFADMQEICKILIRIRKNSLREKKPQKRN